MRCNLHERIKFMPFITCIFRKNKKIDLAFDRIPLCSTVMTINHAFTIFCNIVFPTYCIFLSFLKTEIIVKIQ